MKLKTLKDLIDKEYQAYGLDCDSRKIRQEAIKWVKEDIQDVAYNLDSVDAVSYTHLTLPTILLV